MTDTNKANFSDLLLRNAKNNLDNDAIIIHGQSLSYKDLLSRIAEVKELLRQNGLKPGDRAVVLFPPSHDLYSLVIGMFTSGVLPVFIDTSMPFRKILQSIRLSGAHHIFTTGFATRIFKVFLGSGFTFFVFKEQLQQPFRITGDGEFVQPDIIETNDKDACLVTFTSGSTGRPKAARRSHESLIEQSTALTSLYQTYPGDVCLITFPIAVLQYLSDSSTALLPNIDLRKPGHYDPRVVIDQVVKEKVNILGGSPAFLERLADYIVDQGIQGSLCHVKTVFTGGAPLSNRAGHTILRAFPKAEAFIVYGSTEAEPISHAHINEMLEVEPENGLLVGTEFAENIEILIGPTTPIENVSLKEQGVEIGNIGQVFVSGPHVLKSYMDISDNEGTKIQDGDVLWHNTGDRGYFDAEGRLFLTGRTKDLVLGYDVYAFENQMESLPGVIRAAVIEFNGSAVGFYSGNADHQALKAICGFCEDFRKIKKIPVDGRHNSKIDRVKLRELASGKSFFSRLVKVIFR